MYAFLSRNFRAIINQRFSYYIGQFKRSQILDSNLKSDINQELSKACALAALAPKNLKKIYFIRPYSKGQGVCFFVTNSFKKGQTATLFQLPYLGYLPDALVRRITQQWSAIVVFNLQDIFKLTIAFYRVYRHIRCLLEAILSFYWKVLFKVR